MEVSLEGVFKSQQKSAEVSGSVLAKVTVVEVPGKVSGVIVLAIRRLGT